MELGKGQAGATPVPAPLCGVLADRRAEWLITSAASLARKSAATFALTVEEATRVPRRFAVTGACVRLSRFTLVGVISVVMAGAQSRRVSVDRIFVGWSEAGAFVTSLDLQFQEALVELVAEYGPPDVVEFRQGANGPEEA